jgi:hypothetical protein
VSASLDHARSVVRRAERNVVTFEREGREVNAEVRRYLNRLSDLLFVLARRAAGEDEPTSRETALVPAARAATRPLVLPIRGLRRRRSSLPWRT